MRETGVAHRAVVAGQENHVLRQIVAHHAVGFLIFETEDPFNLARSGLAEGHLVEDLRRGTV